MPLLPPCVRSGAGPRWHIFKDPLTGQDRFFVPSGVTAALQHVTSLAVRAGLHPLHIGSPGVGRSTLLRHLMATDDLSPQER